jgi:hypothetical protein
MKYDLDKCFEEEFWWDPSNWKECYKWIWIYYDEDHDTRPMWIIDNMPDLIISNSVLWIYERKASVSYVCDIRSYHVNDLITEWVEVWVCDKNDNCWRPHWQCGHWDYWAFFKVATIEDLEEKYLSTRDMRYDEWYLQTDHWHSIKQIVRERDWWRCVLCNDIYKLHCHHRSYEHKWDIWKEPLDVHLLCSPCHTLFHANRELQ